MTSASLSLAGAREGLDLDRVAYGLILASTATVQFSPSASQGLLLAALIAWGVLIVRGGARFESPPFWLPMLVYVGLTLVSSMFSIDPMRSLDRTRQLTWFLAVPAVYSLARGSRVTTVLTVILSVGALSATVGIVQFAILHYDSLGQRPVGTLSHWMTYSGQLMLVLCVIAGRVIYGKRDRLWPMLVAPALLVALELTLTRSAWVGVSVGVGLLVAIRDVRLTAVLPVLGVIIFMLAPDPISSRMISTFDLEDPTNRDRVAMARSGMGIIADNPMTGAGPNMIPTIYPSYRTPDAVRMNTPHLHNNLVQIAAERGLPALAAWLWFLGALVVHLVRLMRSGPRMLPAIALASVAAMLTAGLFEYNFGDSEFLMLFLTLIALPFAERHAKSA